MTENTFMKKLYTSRLSQEEKNITPNLDQYKAEDDGTLPFCKSQVQWTLKSIKNSPDNSPEQWSNAIIILLFKKGNKRNIYRPIS